MKSPILEYLAMYGIDPAYIIIGFGALTLILMILYEKIKQKIRVVYAWQRYGIIGRYSDQSV